MTDELRQVGAVIAQALRIGRPFKG